MARLQQLRRFLATYISKQFCLFFAVCLLSIHQATILAYANFGAEAILENGKQLKSLQAVPNSFVLSYLGQSELSVIIAKIAGYTVLLFLAQSIPAFIYGYFNSVNSKRRAALAMLILPALFGFPGLIIVTTGIYLPSLLYVSVPAFIYGCFNFGKNKRTSALAIWILPILLGLPGLLIVVWMYLMSILSAIVTFPGFMFVSAIASHFFDKEDFTEGLTFIIAVIGWFHLFWLAMTIKAWVFPTTNSTRLPDRI
jgi:hypothetical protein